ncbi:MAG TPA: 23S rRNA (pseudouridine(1915)-N(3))-methyltransferase RlmH [Candidatus Saccharimonadales bacterium]|nr:23S rRNA (pseudouridine(1915)-N(3))-methyltransferase RlmH [Candidatus Saccharimonadales bacterium]
MRIHLVTIGKPKLAYAQAGWTEYLVRLQRLHTVRITQLADKYADDLAKIRETTAGTYVVALEIGGDMLDSHQLADFLRNRELEAREVSFVIGGPNGLPQTTRDAADYRWSLSHLTLPHDLAMVVTLEALYRASTISLNLPYHK